MKTIQSRVFLSLLLIGAAYFLLFWPVNALGARDHKDGSEPIWADANPAHGWAQVTLEHWDVDQIFVIAITPPDV